MTVEQKKNWIRGYVIQFIEQSSKEAIDKIDKVLESIPAEVEAWDNKINVVVLPKCITVALLENEANDWGLSGTSFEKEAKKLINSIKLKL